MKNFIITLLTVATLSITSCATLFTGTTDSITFNSTPPGATIYIDGVEYCKTPCTKSVKRKTKDTFVEFKLDGYETKMITLSKEFNMISILNIGNLIGWGIDAVTGSVMKYNKNTYDITLDNDEKTSMINPTRIDIDTQSNTVSLYVVRK